MQPIKTALVGFGISGQCFQAPVIQAVEELELTCVVSSQADKVLAQLPDVSVYPNLETLLAQADIELVVIATPNDAHYPMAQMALEAGKHVVVEKPFVIHSEEGEALIKLAQKKDRVLSVYQSRRFDGDFLTIKALIEQNRLGQVHSLYSSYNRYRPEVKVRWREQDQPGAGILYDLGAHLIDQALQLFGMPASVDAHLRNQRPGAQAVDHFHLVLSYPQTEVYLHGNCLSTTAGPRFQVYGAEGTYIKHGMDTQEDLLRLHQGPGSAQWGIDPQEAHGVLTDAEGTDMRLETHKGGYEGFYQQMAAAIRTGAKPPVTGDEALDVIRVIEAAYKSNHSGQRVKF